MDTVIFALSLAAVGFVVAIAFKPMGQRLTLASCLMFAAYLALDDFVTGLAYFAPALDFLPGRWNWDGKLYSIVLALAVIYALGISPKAAGLIRGREPGESMPWAVVAISAIMFGAWHGLGYSGGCRAGCNFVATRSRPRVAAAARLP